MTRDRCPHCDSKFIDAYAYASRCHACGGVWANSEPPADGKEYGCVWVELQRDADGKRTCIGCPIMQCCHDGTDVLTPGPDCPLGSD